MKNLKTAQWIDRALSPPANFANFTYKDRFLQLLKKSCGPKNAMKLSQRLRCLANASRLGLMLAAAYVLSPLSYGLKVLGFRFVDIDLAQIGSILYLDLYLREDKILYNTPRGKIFVLASRFYDGNPYIIDLYKTHVTLIRHPLLKFLLSPFFMSPVFAGASFRFDSVFSAAGIAHRVWNEYAGKYGDSLIHFPEEDKIKAAKILAAHIPVDQKFVALHVRDLGFYGNPHQNTRNADIDTYKDAILYLIDQGYAVIRIGDPSMKTIDHLVNECGTMLFDYAHSGIRSPMMDGYLLSQCDFLIGLASGPSSIPPLFGINTVLINWYNAATGAYYMPGDLTTFKIFTYKDSGKPVPFVDLFKPPYSKNPPRPVLEAAGVTLIDTPSEDILATVCEFVEQRNSPPSALQDKAQDHIRPENWAYGARGRFSNTILKQYPDLISS